MAKIFSFALLTLAVFQSLLVAFGNSELDNSRALRKDIPVTFKPSIFGLALKTEELRTLALLLTKASLARTLRKRGEFTVFAPTNEAFDLINIDLFKPNFNNDLLQKVLLYHVVQGELTKSDILAGGDANVTTLLGQDVFVDIGDEDIFLESEAANPAQVVKADVIASNGIVHVIDQVLIPKGFPSGDLSELVVKGGLSELENALVIAGLVEAVQALTYKGLTVFAPTNEAFIALAKDLNISKEESETFYTDAIARVIGEENLQKVLLYHVGGEFADKKLLVAKANVSCRRWIFINYFCFRRKKVVTKNDGLSLRFRETDGSLSVLYGTDFDKESKILIPDLRATNGIAHAIETVLIPDNLELP